MKHKFLAIILLAIVIFAIFLIRSNQSDWSAGTGTGEILVSIEPGDSGLDIARKLANSGIVKSSKAFFQLAVKDSRSKLIQPGSRLLVKHSSSPEALDQLLDQKRLVRQLVVREGEQVSEIKVSLEKYFKRSDIEIAFKNVKPSDGLPSLEGSLFPATYSLHESSTVTEIVNLMLVTHRSKLNEINFERLAQKQGLSVSSMLTIASLVQAEGDQVDFQKISRVIRNRLKTNMKLQLDTTVLYAMKSKGRIRVTEADLKVDSKYNTYQYLGLPPGPIGNPGTESLLAALNPAEGDWLYFITVKPGDTRFTASYDEFLTWKELFNKNYSNGLFGKT